MYICNYLNQYVYLYLYLYLYLDTLMISPFQVNALGLNCEEGEAH